MYVATVALHKFLPLLLFLISSFEIVYIISCSFSLFLTLNIKLMSLNEFLVRSTRINTLFIQLLSFFLRLALRFSYFSCCSCALTSVRKIPFSSPRHWYYFSRPCLQGYFARSLVLSFPKSLPAYCP